MKKWNRLAAAYLALALIPATVWADELGQGENVIAGRNLQAILVAMPEITRSGLDLAKYTISVQVVDGHTEVQLFPRGPRPASSAAPSYGSNKPELNTVQLTPDGKHIARVIYCCR